MKRLILGLLIGAICLLGGASALAYNEAPMLRVKVAAGELPPIEERLPEEPGVIEPTEEIGKYGGTLRSFALSNLPWHDLGEEPERGSYLLRITQEGELVPDIAKGYELSDDAKNCTLYLRKGLKWSDGAPFITDDILFMFEDIHWNDEVASWNVLAQVKRVKKIDDYTVRFEFDEPSPKFPLQLGTWYGSGWVAYQPKHYLEKWHIKYNPNANEVAEKEGFESWWQALHYHFWWSPMTDVNKPTLQPWAPKKITSSIKVFERNPYYYAVDPAGNQLPYIDNIVVGIVDKEVYTLKIISGETDIAWFVTSMENYPLYKENEDQGGYQVILIPDIHGATTAFGINQTNSNPVLHDLARDVRFRRALSLAINREEINDIAYFGKAVPRQATVLPSCSYYKPEWGEKHPYARYNPEEGNGLLDEMGLTQRDKDGYRLGSDGKPILLVVEYRERIAQATVVELVKEYWEALGLKILLKIEDDTLFEARADTPDHDVRATYMVDCQELGNYLEGRPMDMMWTPCGEKFSWGILWGNWLDAKRSIESGENTLEDFPEGKLPGEEPPEEIKRLVETVEQRFNSKYGSKEYMELSQKIYDFHAEKLYLIGTVGTAPLVLTIDKNIGNTAIGYPSWGTGGGCINYYAQQLFYKN